MAGVLVRPGKSGQRDILRDHSHVNMEAGVAIKLPQTKKLMRPPEAGRNEG